jgi:hypothetical protein
MVPLSVRIGEALGLSLMKFTLTFDGELPANGKPRRKWEIRKQLHPQLEELRQTHPTLAAANLLRMVPKDGAMLMQHHHSQDEYFKSSFYSSEHALDIGGPIERKGRQFLPLVRNSYALKCALKILFLRKEEPGRVYQGGDIDNRIKTLLDALSVPPHDEHVMDDPTIGDPIYCLLEDDDLITRLDIETHKLLSRPNASQHEVRLVIEVDVRVTHPRYYNHAFMGD